jgi:hypothetical protein
MDCTFRGLTTAAGRGNFPPMTTENDESTTLREFYELQRERIEAVPADSLRHITTDVGACATSILGLVAKAMTFRSRLATLAEYDISLLDQMKPLAQATLHLHGVRQTAISSGPSLEPLVQEATAARELFLLEGKTLVVRKLMDPQAFKDIDGGTGHRKIGIDLVGLVAAFREAWPRIAGKTGLSQAEIDAAEQSAGRLLEAVGQREHAESLSADITLMRAKAFTLLVHSYDQLRRGIAFLRHTEGDMDELFPSIFGGKKSRPRDEGSPTPIHTKPQMSEGQSQEPAPQGQDLPPISKDGPFR